jgi:hypothetical protein
VSGQNFGHQGVAAVSSTGTVRFSDFGPIDDSGKVVNGGLVNTSSRTTRIEFGDNGLPTAASLSTLARELEILEKAPPGSVRLAYFKTTAAETTALVNWMEQSKAKWEDPWLSRWVLLGRNCSDYAREGAARFGAGRMLRLLGPSIPNLDFVFFAALADAVSKPLKAEVTAEITGFRLIGAPRQ